MKKKVQKKIIVFMLFLMLSSFFMRISMPLVQALTTGEVYNYSLEIENKITSVKEKINISKQDNFYLTNNAYREATNYLEEETIILENSFNNQINALDTGISLRSLINNCFLSKLTEYNTYMTEDNTIIDINNITDIKYIKKIGEVDSEITLLTKEEIEEAIKNYYLEAFYNKVLNFDNNYVSILQTYQAAYDNVINIINEYISKLNSKTVIIKNYEQTERESSNNPNMEIDDINIYALIEQEKLALENEKTGLAINNIAIKTTAVNNIYNDIILKIDNFWLQNKTYLELGLDLDISNLEAKYITADNCLNTWFADISDYKNDNYSSYKDNLDINLINCYKNVIDIDKEYETLKSRLNIYLERKPSDTLNINSLMNNVNIYRQYLNKQKVLTHIDSLAELLKAEDEDTIDLLRNFLSITELSEETKDKINNAKYAFYPLSLINNDYNLTIRKNYLVIDKVIGTLTENEILAMIDYNFNYEFINGKLVLHDRKDVKLLDYDIIFKGDINADNEVDQTDIESLKKNALIIKDIKEEDLDRNDINNDGLINISDVTLLSKRVNNFEDGLTTTANFEIERIEKDNFVYYNVYLKTDGIVRGFEFDFNASKDLIFNSYNTLLSGIDVNDTNNPSKILGYGLYKNDDLIITLVFSKDDNIDLNQTELDLTKLILVLDSYETISFNQLISIHTKPVAKEESSKEQVIVQQLSKEEESEEFLESSSIEEKENVEDKLEISKNEDNKNKVLTSNIIKITIVVLLGTLIIYLLNKNDNAEELKEKNNEEVNKSQK